MFITKLKQLHDLSKFSTLIIVMDISASVNPRHLVDFVQEIKKVRIKGFHKMRILFSDHKIRHEDKYEVDFSDDISCSHVKIPALGGGGTDFTPVIEKCNEMLANNQIGKDSLLIYLSDLMGPINATCNIPVVWAVVDNNRPQEVPFGDIIHFAVEKILDFQI